MSSKYEPAVVSGGVSPLGFIKQWNLKIPETEGAEDEETTLFFGWQKEEKGFSISHLAAFHPQGSTEPSYSKSLMRVACHFWLDRIPDRGLDEVLETLKDIYDFYGTQIEDKSTYRLPQLTSLEATITESIVRPVFPITEEEE
jgi:hypothetical protein